MADNLNETSLDRNIDIQEPPKNKELTLNESWYKKLSNKYYSLIDKLHLRSVTNVIDKVMPSMIFFLVLFLIIIAVIVYFTVFSSAMNSYTLKINLDGKLLTDSYTITLTSKDPVELVGTGRNVKGPVTFNALSDSTINAKITLKDMTQTTKQFITNKSEIILNIVSNSTITTTKTDQKENLFSFILVTQNGTLQKDAVISVSCQDFNMQYNLIKGVLNDQKIPCNTVSIIANIDNYPGVKQNCNFGMCKILVQDNLSSDVKVMQNVPKNKLIVYVNGKDGKPASNMTLEIRDNSETKELIDSGITGDFGSYSSELLSGTYNIILSDPSGKYAAQTKQAIITAGNAVTVSFVLDVLPMGNLNINFKVEDDNFVSGTIFLKDENQNILETKKYDSNTQTVFPLVNQGNYIISSSLDVPYNDKYLSEDITVNYDQNSGDKTIEKTIRKYNSFTDQNVVVQVIDSTTQNPIPFARIWFENENKEYLTNIGIITTDYNGIYYLILPKGQYDVKLKHNYLSGIATFNVQESKSLSLTSVSVVLPVAWGNSTVNVCLTDNKKPIGDAIIEVYSSERGLESTFFVDKNQNCASTQIKSLESVYFKVTKQDYLDLYSQTFFMENNGSYSFNLELTPIIPNNPLEKLTIEFQGIYSDSQLSKPANELLPMNEYYYAFKVKVPKNKPNKLFFYGIAGNKTDENIELSKLQVISMDSLGNTIFYSNYNSSFDDTKLIGANTDDNFLFKSKSFTSEADFESTFDNETEIMYSIRVLITNNVILSTPGGDSISFWYWFGTDKKDLSLNNISRKLGTQICSDPICVNAYSGNDALSNSHEIASKGNVFGKILFDNNSDIKKMAIYNLKESGSSSIKQDVGELFLNILQGKLSITDIFGNKTESGLSSGPIYLNDQIIDYRNYIDFNFDYQLLTPDSSSMVFKLYKDDWNNTYGEYKINLTSSDKAKLNVEVKPNDIIVPYIKNDILIRVTNDVGPVVGAEVKYYDSFNGIWKYVNTSYTGNDGSIDVTTNPLGIGDKIKIVVFKQSYQPFAKEIVSDFNFFTVKDKLSATINYPTDGTKPNVFVDINNTSNYDLNIYDLKYYWDSSVFIDFVNLLFKKDVMEGKFKDGSLLHSNDKLSLPISFNPDALMMAPDISLFSSFLNFKYIPVNVDNSFLTTIESLLDTVFTKNIPLDIKFIFNGEPSNSDDCLQVDLRKDDKEISNVTFLEASEESFDLHIINNCELNGLSNYKFKDVNLSVNSDIPIAIKISKDGKDKYSSIISKNLIIPLPEVVLAGQDYTYGIKLSVDDLNDLAMSNVDAHLTFNVLGGYSTDQSNYNSTNSIPKNLKLDVSFRAYENCLYFGVDTTNQNKDLFSLEGTDGYQFPYYLDGERSKAQGNIIEKPGEAKMADNADLPATFPGDQVTDYFEFDSLPLQISNGCNKPVTIQLCKSDDEYCKVNDDYLSISSVNYPVSFGNKITLDPDQNINFSLDRPDNFSGAVLLSLYKLDNSTTIDYVKDLKINVESSTQNKYFLKNPFITDLNNNLPVTVYKNEYYPHGLESVVSSIYNDIIIPEFSIWHPFRDNLFYFLTGIKNGQDQNTYKYDNYNEVLKDKVNGDFSKYSFKLFATDEFGGWLWEAPNFRYFIYSKSIPSKKDYSFDFMNSFAGEDTSKFFGKDNYKDPIQYKEYLSKYVEQIGTEIKNNQDFPYFINLGTASVKGWCYGIHNSAATFCPNGFEPVKIYMANKQQGDLWGFEKSFWTNDSLSPGVKEYLFGGYVSLDDDYWGGCDWGEGTYSILTICKLTNITDDVKREKFSDATIDSTNNVIFNDAVEVDKTINNYLLTNTGISFGNIINFTSDDAYKSINSVLNSNFKDYTIYYPLEYSGTDKTTKICLDKLVMSTKDSSGNDINLAETDPIYLAYSKLFFDNYNNSYITKSFILKDSTDAGPNSDSVVNYSCNGLDTVYGKNGENSLKDYISSNIQSNNLQKKYYSDAEAKKYVTATTNYYDAYVGYVKSKWINLMRNSQSVINFGQAVGTAYNGADIDYSSILDFKSFVKLNYNVDIVCTVNSSECGYNIGQLTTFTLEFIAIIKANSSNIRVYKEKPKPGFMAAQISNCFGGGLTGQDAMPKISFTDDVNCDFGSQYGCNLKQFVNYLQAKAKLNAESSFKVQLLYDNYTKEALDIYQQKGFLQNSGLNISFLSYKQEPIGVLQSGIYDARLIVDSDNNFRVYLSFNTYLMPDHLFYYMPYTPTPDYGIGTTIDTLLKYDSSKTYSTDKSKSALFDYTLNKTVYTLDNLPIALKGEVSLSSNIGGNGELYFAPNDLHIKQVNENLDYTNTINGATYAKLFVKKNNLFYPASLYYDVIESSNDGSITVKSQKKEGLDYSDISEYLVYVLQKGLDSQNIVDGVESISNIVDEIGKSNMCYLNKEGKYLYYWNIFKLLGEQQ